MLVKPNKVRWLDDLKERLKEKDGGEKDKQTQVAIIDIIGKRHGDD